MSIANALQVLANYRVRNTRAAQDSFNKGLLILHSSARLADDGNTVHVHTVALIQLQSGLF